MVAKLDSVSKSELLRIFIVPLLILAAISCTIDDPDPDPLQNINSVLLGESRFDFKSARLSITGPANITGVNSHVRAKLELSSEATFQEPFQAKSNLMAITLLSVNQGISLPSFPLENGNYDVFPPSGFVNPEVIDTLDGVSFCYGPVIRVGYRPETMGFESIYESWSGTIQVNFDVKNSLVKLTYDYFTREGVKVSGSNTLPLNLSSFNP